MTPSRTHRLSLDQPVTGVAAPVSALRSARSCGIGEFLDLPLLGEWCADAGLSLIQILPVNDTGTLSSPYSAVSAFALHPVYIRLEEVPGTGDFQHEIDEFRSFAEARPRSDHEGVLGFKMGILYRAYQSILGDELDRDLDDWISENDWVRQYAVYKCLKDRHEQRSWVEWPDQEVPSARDIEKLWVELREYVRFYSWIQMQLDGQFRDAVDALHSSGIYLKGDIPILMNVDSTDVWGHRNLFDLEYGAGAPPDMFTRTGQSWGFPIYRWDEIEADDYGWWLARLQIAAKYYDVFRIDHVIGFFRIWSQPAHERTAVLGHYEPSPAITHRMMEEAGLTTREIQVLTRAWTTRTDAAAAIGDDADRVLETYFEEDSSTDRELHDGLHFLNRALEGERFIDLLDDNEAVREFLIACHHDRSFVSSGIDQYYPAWYWDESKGLASLSDEQTVRFNQMVEAYRKRSRPVWTALGRKTLTAIAGATDMLACAEDLGAVPDGLRDVLNDLDILSLKIERWETNEDGTFIDPAVFPHLSVSTPSVHDLSTLRVWWEESDEHVAYFDVLGLHGECPSHLTVEVAEAVIQRSLRSASAVVVFQIQDLFSLTYDLRIDPPMAERFNVPGTVGDHNWSYRIPVSVETLRQHGLGSTVGALIAAYRGTSPSHSRS